MPVRALTPGSRKLFPKLGEFLAFIVERHNVFLRRQAGFSKPWTMDAMLRSYRFTNVYRELDKETEWILSNWLMPLWQHEDAWFAALVARHINWSPTLTELTLPVAWNKQRFIEEIADYAATAEGKVFSSAYMINQTIPGGKGMPKYTYLAEYIFTPAWKQRELLRPRFGDTLEHFHTRLMYQRGLGSFMAAQVVADVKYFSTFLINAPDFMTWAAPGPGSERGLRAVQGEDPAKRWKPALWLATLQELQYEVNQRLPPGWPQLDAQNVQNCLCEFSKYTRGYSRQRYPGEK